MTRVFVLTNHKGGVGKSTSATTIALGIAALLRRAGASNSRVLLIDTDSQGQATLVTADGRILIDGEVKESQPPERLVTTFNALFMPEDQRGETTLVTYEIEPVGDTCKLTVVHEGLTPDSPMTLGIHNGWVQITSSLKSLLETGTPLDITLM